MIPTPDAPSTLPKPTAQAPRRRRFAWIGITLGLIAIALAAAESYIVASAEAKPPPTRESAGAKANRLLREIAQRKEPEPVESSPARHPLGIASLVLGVGAIGCGAIAWSRHERIRPATGAVALGLIALAWQWVLIGIGVAIALFILAHLMSG